MTREIKFRAWDGVSWRTDFVIDCDGKIRLIKYCADGEPNTIVDWKLVQYTGLKDKNGEQFAFIPLTKSFITSLLSEQEARIRKEMKNGLDHEEWERAKEEGRKEVAERIMGGIRNLTIKDKGNIEIDLNGNRHRIQVDSDRAVFYNTALFDVTTLIKNKYSL